MKERILYLMHVDWHWIKQRPHFLAEELSSFFDVIVSYPHNNRRDRLVKNKTNMHKIPILSLPFSRYRAIYYINAFIQNMYFWGLIYIYKPSVVWFTFPTMIPLFGMNRLIKKVIVYDCMDDALEFPEVKANKIEMKRIESLEKRLLSRANTVFASSEHLKNILCKRYYTNKNIIILNNGIDQNRLGNGHVPQSSDLSNHLDQIRLKKVMYIGTISNWIDFELIIASLNKLKDIIYILIGPSGIDPPKHERLLVFPPVEHSQVFTLMSKADILVMPFIVNELIKSVNPVKVYEYIYSGKPTIVVRYGETEQFAQYVTLYDTYDEYIKAIQLCTNRFIETDRGTSEATQRFVMNNTWKERANYINNILKGITQ